jgi:hypothetical protein
LSDHSFLDKTQIKLKRRFIKFILYQRLETRHVNRRKIKTTETKYEKYESVYTDGQLQMLHQCVLTHKSHGVFADIDIFYNQADKLIEIFVRNSYSRLIYQRIQVKSKEFQLNQKSLKKYERTIEKVKRSLKVHVRKKLQKEKIVFQNMEL